MNVVYQSLGLLLLVTGALSAAVDTLGGKCTIGVDTCSVNGAVCDKASQTCVCQFGYVQSGAICSRPAMGLCGAGMCKSWDTMTCDANLCKCDTSKGYIEASGNCVCDSAKFLTAKTGGGCIGNVGAACTVASDCRTDVGMVCTSSKCACDTTKNYKAGSNNDATCACNDVTFFTFKTGGGCIGKVGAACTADSQCLTGMKCGTTSSKCECNTALSYVSGADGAATCACASGKTAYNGICCTTGETNSNGICCAAGTVKSSGACKTVNDGDCSTILCASNMDCDSGTSKCKCDTTTKFYAAGAPGDSTCIGKVGAACTAASDCVTGLVCTGNKCACNTTLNYAAGSNGAATCDCASGYTLSNGLCCATGKSNMNGICCATGESNSNGICCAAGSIESNGACKKVWGQTCSAAGDCLSTLTCATTCKCDATKNYAAGSAGATTCACNSATFFTDKTGGGCIGKVGAACTAASDCLTGLVCTSSKCACDTTKNFVAGTDGAASCACATGYTYSSFYGKCAINVGGACTRDSTYVPCVDNAVCDRATDTCKCDSVAGYMVAGTTCSTTSCISGYTMVNGRCVADLNGACIPATQSGVCVGGATCFAGNTTTVPQCLCDSGQYDYKFSCSGAGGVVASLACLLMALFMTSRLM